MTTVQKVEWVAQRDEDTLPPDWWMSDRGPVSPAGRLYSVIPQGCELADLAIFDAILDDVLGPVTTSVTVSPSDESSSSA